MDRELNLTEKELADLIQSCLTVSTRFQSLDQLYEYGNEIHESIIRIINQKQVGFYAELGVQPDFIMPSPYDGKNVFYYLKSRTNYVWWRWRRSGMYVNIGVEIDL